MLSDWLRQQREANGLSQRDVDLAIPRRVRGWTHRIETGKSRPSSMDVAALARALDVPWTVLMRLAGYDPALYDNRGLRIAIGEDEIIECPGNCSECQWLRICRSCVRSGLPLPYESKVQV